jgi:hypothetical protein
MLRWVVMLLLVMGAARVATPEAARGADCPITPGAIAEADEYASIDARALAAPASACDSVAALAAYLTQATQDERQKARAIFRWVAANVAYDMSAAGMSDDAGAVLACRRGVCYDYAVLFKALAQAAGLKSELIIGHSSKFKPFEAAERDDWLNHAWNAVEIDGRWQLLDCCWGAGYLNQHRQFVRRFTPHYFVTAPEVFICDHFPEDARWQLLDAPITKDEYLQRVQLRPPFFECGLRLVSHHSAVIDADGYLAVTIDAPPETAVTAVLCRDGRRLGDGYTFAQRDSSGYVIRSRFPAAGAYVLRIFARRADAPGDQYGWALDYSIRARAAAAGAPAFPKAYGSFMTRNCRVERGLGQALRAGDAADLCISAPSAEDVVVSTGGAFVHLPPQGEAFSGTVPVSPGPVVIFAKFPGASAYEGLLQYTAQ